MNMPCCDCLRVVESDRETVFWRSQMSAEHRLFLDTRFHYAGLADFFLCASCFSTRFLPEYHRHNPSGPMNPEPANPSEGEITVHTTPATMRIDLKITKDPELNFIAGVFALAEALQLPKAQINRALHYAADRAQQDFLSDK